MPPAEIAGWCLDIGGLRCVRLDHSQRPCRRAREDPAPGRVVVARLRGEWHACDVEATVRKVLLRRVHRWATVTPPTAVTLP
eukprot:3761441-Prymnesium_polylepis.1